MFIVPLSFKYFNKENKIGNPNNPNTPNKFVPTNILIKVTTGWSPNWLPTILGSNIFLIT